MSKKKGKLVEILSRSRFYDDIHLYQVAYRDLDKIVTVSLEEFILLSGTFELIPISRIVEVKKGSIVVYQKAKSKINK
jgi:uncharacterized protein (UPF0248 family)